MQWHVCILLTCQPQPTLYTSVLQHAAVLELLSGQLKEGNRALDVGSGTGYLTACFAHMVSYEFILCCGGNLCYDML